jgi:hypothetical protein
LPPCRQHPGDPLTPIAAVGAATRIIPYIPIRYRIGGSAETVCDLCAMGHLSKSAAHCSILIPTTGLEFSIPCPVYEQENFKYEGD